MNCDETFNAGICYVTDAYKRVCGFNEELHADLEKCRSENAKLRELVRDMAECMDNSQPRCKKCKFRELNCQWFKIDDRMRELGVEVDDGTE